MVLWSIGLVAPPARAIDAIDPTGAMTVPRAEHTAVRLLDGRVLVAGGSNTEGRLASSEIYDPSTGTWEVVAPLHAARSEHTAVLLQNGRVLVAGGRDTNGSALASAELFDPATGAWTVTGTLKRPRLFHTASPLPNGNVLVVGGASDENGTGALESAEVYRPATGTWGEAGLLTQARGLHTATFSGSTLIIFGGVSNGNWQSTIETYDTRQGSWGYVFPGPGPSERSLKYHTVSRLPNYDLLVSGGWRDAPLSSAKLLAGYAVTSTGSLSGGRYHHSATELPDGRVLVLGGWRGPDEPVAAAEAFQRTTGSWMSVGSLTSARARHTATLLADGRVLAAGGTGTAGFLASSEVFTPAPAEFKEAASMISGRQYHQSTMLPDGRVLVSGGYGWGQTILGSAEVYDPELDYWKAAPGFSPRAGHSSTLLPNGKVLVAGGTSSSFTPSFPATTTVYDPARNQWSPTGMLNQSRAWHATALLADGRVLVAGGHRTSDYTGLKTAEIYDPVTGVWSPVAPMLAARSRAAAVLLTSGKVLVLSGTVSPFSGDPGTAELFDPVTGTWTSAGTQLFPRAEPSVVLLRDGRVLVCGGNDPSSPGTAEIYDPVTNSWTAAPRMTTDAFFAAACLMHDGRVLVAGNYSSGPPNPSGKAEIYDPILNSWTSLGKLTTVWHTLTQLKGRRIFIAGGELPAIDPATPRARLYDPEPGQSHAIPPVLASAHFDAQDRLVLSGKGLTGDPLAAPVVHLRRLDNGFTTVLAPDPTSPWSEFSFVSEPLIGIPKGHAMATVFVDGSPAVSVILTQDDAELAVADASGTSLADDSSVAFGSQAPGTGADLTLTVRNDGSAALADLSAVITGRDAASFVLTGTPLPGTLEPRASTSLVIRFAPVTPGAKTAVLQLASTDANESPFELKLVGTATDSSPSISSLDDLTILENQSSEVLAFVVSDAETPAEQLMVTATSSNIGLVAAEGLVLAGFGANRTLALTPLPHQSGSTRITLTVSDGVFQSASSFTLMVSSVNAPPTLDVISDPADLLENAGSHTLSLTGLGPGLGDTEPITVTALSSNPALIPHPTVDHANPAAQATLTISPSPDLSGTAVITVKVSDGQTDSAPIEKSFKVQVRPRLRLVAPSMPEGDDASTILEFVVRLSSPQDRAVTFEYGTAGGTATAGQDFEPSEGTAVIPPGDLETRIPIRLLGETRFELHETLNLTVSNPVNSYLTDTSAEGTILNDDPQPALSLIPGSVTESPDDGPFQIWFSVKLPSAQSVPVAWQVATRAGTAQTGVDYAPLEPATLVFAPGETTKWISIQIPATGSDAGEGDEDFFVDFTTTAGPATTTSTRGTIRPLKILEFRPLENGLYILRFPTGNGQRYIIEEAASPAGPWTNNSAIVLGTGGLVTQVVFSFQPSSYFRVVAAPAAPGAPDLESSAGGSGG